MIHRLREDSMLERSTLLIERAGPLAKSFRRRLIRRLTRSRVRGLTAELREVRVGGWLTPTRSLVVASIERHSDLRCYVGAQAVGVHLEVIRYVAVEPPWAKRVIAGALLRGAWWGWSLPKNVRQDEEVSSFMALVDAYVNDVTKDCATRVASGSDAIS